MACCYPRSDIIKPLHCTGVDYFGARCATARSRAYWFVFCCEGSRPSFAYRSATNYFRACPSHPGSPLKPDPYHHWWLGRGSRVVTTMTASEKKLVLIIMPTLECVSVLA